MTHDNVLQMKLINSRKYIYTKDDEIMSERIVFFGISWPILWIYYLLRRRQLSLIFLSFVFLTAFFLFTNKFFTNFETSKTFIFCLTYFIYTSLILCIISSITFIKRKKNDNIKYVYHSIFKPVDKKQLYDNVIEDSDITKILIVAYDKKIYDTSSYDFVYNIGTEYFTDNLIKRDAIEAALEIINEDCRCIHLSVDTTHINSKNIKTYKANIKAQMLKYITYCYVMKKDENKFIPFIFEDDSEYDAYLSELFPSEKFVEGIWDMAVEAFLKIIKINNFKK